MKAMLIHKIASLCVVVLLISGCNSWQQTVREPELKLLESYVLSSESDSVALVSWRSYFTDPILVALIDTALKNNQELNIFLQEIEIGRNEVLVRKGEYLPFVNFGAIAEGEKVGRYTRNGAVEEQLHIDEGRAFPKPLGNFGFGANASWEVDIWKKLRNAKTSAMNRYLASVEGQHFLVTNLISEIAESYYSLLALDNMKEIVDQNIIIQSDALRVVKLQKESAKVTQLAVNRFEAQLLNTQAFSFEIKQQITETENRLNFLTGRTPAPIQRSSMKFTELEWQPFSLGVPAQLLMNRPDIRQAEWQLEAARLDVKVAKANFYPSLRISAGVGFQAFNPVFLIQPESMLYNMAGDLVAPLINRNAIKANYRNANARQLQAVINYEQTILNAYVDVLNELSRVQNYSEGVALKEKEVAILSQSVDVSNSLFNSARADYSEVLLTQREALVGKIDLVQMKLEQMHGLVNLYRALGGGWQ